MATNPKPGMLGVRTYAARRFDAPSRLPHGMSRVDLADFFLNICRGQDPNIAGFSPASLVPAYSLWPYHRYGPLFITSNEFRLMQQVRGIDGRKQGIVAEDLGIGFALGACDLLGGLPVITKWEAGQEARRESWARELATRHGISEREAAAVSRKLGQTLAGADFVGYSSTEKAWLICEAKGSLKRPSNPRVVFDHLRDPDKDLGLTRRGEPRKPYPLLKGIRQKSQTGDSARSARVGVTSLLVYASTATEDDGHMTTVDYIDPDPTPEQIQVLEDNGDLAGDFIAASHYAWVAGVLGLPVSPWGYDIEQIPRVEVPELQVSVAFPRLVRLDLTSDVTITLLIGLASEVLQILRERDLHALREWSSNPRVFRSDGLLVRTVVDDDRPDSVAHLIRPPGGLGQGRLVEVSGIPEEVAETVGF